MELLAPAGNLEKLKIAVEYGADAVYIGGEEFGLRAYADNFSFDDMREGVAFAHQRGKKVYLTMNIIPHNSDIDEVYNYIDQIKDIGFDAIIAADPGIISILKDKMPDTAIHLSTQANNTNWKSAEFWYNYGIKRIVLARELSKDEICDIRAKVPEGLELEVFVHGAMCISYSGRCLLSNYMTRRDSNKGACAQPCRWKYHLMEEQRPGEFMPVEQNERGTFIYNSKDLCLIEHIKDLDECGVCSLKIEGRMKSLYYIATVVKAYRDALDEYYNSGKDYTFDSSLLEEIAKSSHRYYTKGFFTGYVNGSEVDVETSTYVREYDFVGIVKEFNQDTMVAKVEQRNRIFLNDEVELIQPDVKGFTTMTIDNMKNEKMEDIDVAQHPQMILYIKFDKPVKVDTILRKKL